MMRIDEKHLQAAAALTALVIAAFVIFSPLVAAFNGASAQSSELHIYRDRIELLEDRLETERRAFAVELAGAGPLLKTYFSREDTSASLGLLETFCARLAEALVSQNVAIASPCSISQSPLGESYMLYAVGITAQGAPNAILAAADEAQLGQASLGAFRLAVDDPTRTHAESTLYLQFTKIIPGGGEAEE